MTAPISKRPHDEDNSSKHPSETYAWYVVLVLLIVYIFSFIDRQILSLLVDPIKADLDISDSQVSYLGGFAFALFYTFFGIPIARMADSKNRKVIITIGLAVWSIFTMLCGTANRFLSFAIYRMGVGVGEASLSPSAYSMITDMFRPERLAIAISVYSSGIYIGTGLANIFGGLIIGYAEAAEQLSIPLIGNVTPWQYVFFCVGFPGLLFTLVMLSIKEPLRQLTSITGDHQIGRAVSFSKVLEYIKANQKTFFYHNLGFAFFAFVAYGSVYWIPSYLIRVHDMTAQNAGLYLGSIIVVFGTSGIIFGGYLADKLIQRGYSDAKFRIAIASGLAHIPLGIAYPLMPDAFSALLLLCPAFFALSMPFGIAAAAIQKIMPANMRAQGSAIYLFTVNLIGLGLGPSAVAWCTDYLYSDPNKVNLSLLWINTVFGILATILLYKGMRHYKVSLKHLEQHELKTREVIDS